MENVPGQLETLGPGPSLGEEEASDRLRRSEVPAAARHAG